MSNWTTFKSHAAFRKMTVENLRQDIQPQELLERWLKFAFDEAERMAAPVVETLPVPTDTLNPADVIRLYNQVFNRNVDPLPYRLQQVQARIADGHKIKRRIGLREFELVFKDRQRAWQDDPQNRQYLTLETMLRASKFFKYLDFATQAINVRDNQVRGFKIQ